MLTTGLSKQGKHDAHSSEETQALNGVQADLYILQLALGEPHVGQSFGVDSVNESKTQERKSEWSGTWRHNSKEGTRVEGTS